jgi:RNA polymerase sigma-70 factor, ECF subfamily
MPFRAILLRHGRVRPQGVHVVTVVPLTFGFGFVRLPVHADASGGIDGRAAHTIMNGPMPRNQPASHPVADVDSSPADSVMKKRDMTDEALLGAYLEGDRSAFETIISRYSAELLHFLTRFLGSRAAAEDVFQETFLQIHLSAESFDTTRRFKPWLFTIAANKARDYHRKHNRRAQVSLSASIGDEGEGQRFIDLLEAELPGPESPILDAERSRLVKQVVDAMPGHLREILLLSYFQQLSYNQIADTLEIPLGTVKSRLHTAVANFANAWKAARAREGVRRGEREEDHQ